jgi:hypothetical protein
MAFLPRRLEARRLMSGNPARANMDRRMPAMTAL